MTKPTDPVVARALAWAYDGAAHLRGLMTRLGDDAFPAPSALPGWSRAHVLTHLARNADAMINLLTWASTGEPTPAYASPEARNADIEAGAVRTPAEIRADVIDSSDRLADTVRALPEKAWDATVLNVQGREIRAGLIPWLRAREMWIHAVDLDVGATFAEFPPPMLTELISDVAAALGAKPGCPPLRLVAGSEHWSLGDPEAHPVTVVGPLPELAAWLAGRSVGRELRADGERTLPELPRWL